MPVELWELAMRVMELPPFPHTVAITDVRNLYRYRFSQTIVMWPNQAIPLLSYMCAPGNPQTRAKLRKAVRAWADGSTMIPSGLGRIQHEWLRVADIFHTYRDLYEGRHQQLRGGASLGKAISLVNASAESYGTGSANLWHLWRKYKDVSHLITAAAMICADVRTFAKNESFGPFALSPNQFIPWQVAMMLPDLVIAVGLEFERLGLEQMPHSREEPVLNPDTVWRIPVDFNVIPLKPPTREIRPQDLQLLNNRRAGNRGRTNRRERSESLAQLQSDECEPIKGE